MEKISRAEAQAKGLKRYYTAEPCKRGHLAERNVAGRKCVECGNAISLAWANAHPEREWKKHNREQYNAARRAHRAENPDRYREYQSKWRSENQERASQYGSKWAKKNPEKVRAKRTNRRARKMAATGKFTADDIAELLRLQRHRCAWCRTNLRKTTKSIDHIRALARGGSNDRRNLQMLCTPCNSRKGALDPIDFAQRHGRLL